MATTEPVADYMLQAAGADNLTPWAFQADIMNGTDPSAQDVAVERSLFTQHKVKVFVYNQQVTDSLTESFISLAQANGIPVVGVYETMPVPGYDYQSWMLAEVQALQKAVAEQDLHRAPVMTAELLRLDGVGVRLGGREILRDVSFTIRPGEFTGLIGPNGAGKTTLLRVILGLQPVTSGAVLIDGAPRAGPRRLDRVRAAEAGHRAGHAAAGQGRGLARASTGTSSASGCRPGLAASWSPTC